ncbi:hypothetical protein N6L27_03685 [Leisingera sp. SS27]|uniref:hypothetical protein n=1 Tax=Leisingera sp. SS27 TaxID=2979462 RepID=UPI00232B62D0|nr:hypothetical protein [Leisingera sp. SS27]MDC0657092.1 hypothetical protein [Leisingera sp. SS27]
MTDNKYTCPRCGGTGEEREAVPADQVGSSDLVKWCRTAAFGAKGRAGIRLSACADHIEAQVARIERLETENAILRAKATGAVYVCPECDIEGCKHVRAALQEPQS